jgi:hypothetical protein
LTRRGETINGIAQINEQGVATISHVLPAAGVQVQGMAVQQNKLYTSLSLLGLDYVFHSSETTSSYPASFYTTTFDDCGDRAKKKKLIGVHVTAEIPPELSSPPSVTVTVEYNIGSSWTTLGTFNLTTETTKAFVRDSSGATLSEFNEVRFRITSNNGASITQLKYEWEEENKTNHE